MIKSKFRRKGELMNCKDKYKKHEKCMCFSNDEIKQYLLSELIQINDTDIILLTDTGVVMDINSQQKISTVVFDGIKEEFFINFYDDQTSLFFDNQEIMFIDDNIKNDYTSSDTCYNMVYEGYLRDKDHEEILNFFAELINLIVGYKEIKVEFIPVVEKNRHLYDYFDNKIHIYKKGNVSEKYVFENLTFKLN